MSARDSFFADTFPPAPTTASANVDELELDDEHWFEDAARDTLTTDTSTVPHEAVGAAALTVDPELVRRPPRRPTRRLGTRPRAARGRRLAGLSVVLLTVVVAIAVITSPPHASTGVARTREPSAPPRAHSALAPPRHRDRRPPDRPRATQQRTAKRLRRRRSQRPVAITQAPLSKTPARVVAHAPGPAAVRRNTRPRPAAGRVTPGDLPLASQAP